MRIKPLLLLVLLALGSVSSYAQLSKNPNKFLGNITTAYAIRNDFNTYWNQLTPENETKWGSVEGTRDVYNWETVDKQYKYCKEKGFPFKFHTLVWGSQYPRWMDNLSESEQLEEVTEWFDAVAARYPDLDYIDVVNEALPGHAPAPYKNALGGDGVSGYDWIVTSFIMARDRWPNAVLVYNDYNTFRWNIDGFIDLLQKIVAAGAPVDAAGCQSHDLNDMSGADFKVALERIHNQTGLPILISEYDIDKEDDAEQLTRISQQLPIMWEADYVAGVTFWGYIYGSTWVDHSGLIKNGVERPAFKWLREYMLTDAAINAKSPLINTHGYAYITALANTVEINAETTITGKARSQTETIDKIEVYVNSALLKTYTSSSFELVWTPTVANNDTFTMKVFNAASEIIFEKTITIKAYEPSTPFNIEPIAIPGTLEVEFFDKGVQGIAYSDNSTENQGDAAFRIEEGVDIVTGNQGKAIGYTAVGEWLLYTVTVESEQVYKWNAFVASGTTGAAFRIYIGNTDVTGKIEIPQTADGTWNTYVEVQGETTVPLPVGTYQLRLEIEGSNGNIDKLEFSTKPVLGINDAGSNKLNGVYEVFSIMGVKIGTVEINNGNLQNMKAMFTTGVYLLRQQGGNGEARRILIP